MPLLLGLDIGTTSTIGILIDDKGRTLATANRPCRLHSPHPNWAEEDADEWWRNCCALVPELLAAAACKVDDIAAVGVTGMVPAVVLMDETGHILRPSMQQNDARAVEEMAAMRRAIDPDAFFARTGGSINQQLVAPKLRWVERHEPQVFGRIAAVFGSYDYIAFRLTGRAHVEQNWGLESGFVDLSTGAYDDALVALGGIGRGQLPPLVVSQTIVGEVTPEAGAATGLAAGTPVVAGCADHVASAFVAGAVTDGDLVVKFGGAGDILLSAGRPVTDRRLFIDHHIVPGLFFVNGCMATSGSLLDWILREFAAGEAAAAQAQGQSPHARLDRLAAEVSPGAEGVVLLPYFLGEKTPLHDPAARGTLVGLGLHHRLAHVWRAALEGVAFGFRHHIDVFAEMGLAVRRVLACDGGAASDLWLQIAADAFDRPVQRLLNHPGSSLGAAYVAGVGAGIIDGWGHITNYVKPGRIFEPVPSRRVAYDQAYGLYRDLYERLKTLYPRLAALSPDWAGLRMSEPGANRWKRYEVWDARPLRLDKFAVEDPANGFQAAASPADPRPSIGLADSRVTEMDGVAEADFDMIDYFIARHHIDPTVAPEAMALDSAAFARMLIDIDVPRDRVVRLAAGMTPAKLAEALCHLNAVELTFAQTKLRSRRQPANQAHVTNAKDDPIQMAADAATAALYGFDEVETTVRVSRNARSNAIACAVGAAAAREGVLIQCSVEEAEELRLGLAGLTSYTETMSVYGTEASFVDGDDTPWSKAFLAAAYASRGLKARCTSGSGAELLMGYHEAKSMLYLEARCLCLQRAMGVQGTQNGAIDGAPLVASVPGGLWEILAENVLAALLDLECASGNDTRFTESEIRVGAKIVPHLLAGTDFICSGLGSIPAYDNSFNASLFNAAELEDFLAIQRDYLADGGLQHVDEGTVMQVRGRAIAAMAAVLEELGLARLPQAKLDGVLVAHGSLDTDSLTPGDVARINDGLIERGITVVDVVRALAKRGFETEARRLLFMARQRTAGDYLQTAAILRDGKVVSAVNDPNRYGGPGTGYRLSPERRAAIARMRDELTRDEVLRQEGNIADDERRRYSLRPRGTAAKGNDPVEVVVGVGPGFGTSLHKTTGEVPLSGALGALFDGIAAGGGKARLVRFRHTADTSFLGLSAARLAGSGVGIGMQAKGTAVIHRADLAPHMNLELFSMAPLLGLDHYRAIGHNAALHAQGARPEPIVVHYGGEALGARHHVRTALLYAIETAMVEPGAKPQDLEVVFHGSAR